MVKFNMGYKYNCKGNERGAVYNSDTYILIINMHELLTVDENISELLATYLLLEKKSAFYDELFLTALYNKHNEKFNLTDETAIFLLYKLTEELGIKDELTDLLVLAFLHDNINVVEQAKLFAHMLTNDQIKIKEITDLQAFLKTLDKCNLKDLELALSVMLSQHDRFGLTDHEPKTAVSDFLIGAIDDLDRAFEWLVPFGLKVDWGKTKMDVMPEAELTKIEIPGIDGSIIEDSVYKDRMFEIVAYSEQGLTIAQREDLKKKITRVLDATKHQDKKLTVQAASTSFDVRYEGQADIQNGASYVKATIPLRAAPYGYDMFEHELEGAGVIINEGHAPLRVVHTIIGAINNPTFSLGTITYRYNGSIPTYGKLVIDHDMMTAYVEDNQGNRTNAMAKLTGDFQAIPIDSSVVLNCVNPTKANITTTWRNKVLW